MGPMNLGKLILVPGLHGTAELFGPLLDVLPPELPRRAVAYPTDRALRYRALVELLAAQLADEREMVLVGESFSGAIALRLAAACPGRVRAVILCASFIMAPVPRILCYIGAPLALLRFPIPNLAVRVFLTGYSAPAGLVRDLQREVHRVSPHVLAQRVLLASTVRAAEPLRRCPVPILLLVATRDRLIGARGARRILRARPDVTVSSIDAPHLILQRRPAEAWRAMRQFLETRTGHQD